MRIEYFASTACDPSGNGEGRRFVGFLDVSTDGAGVADVGVVFLETLDVGEFITATATGPDGSTSEFSPCALVQDPTFTVNSTNDTNDGTCDAFHCSLREAINASNADVTKVYLIAFNISTTDPGFDTTTSAFTITPTTALPTITDQAVIDGYTQPGASPNTNPPDQGTNAVLKIVLDGPSAGGTADGLRLTAGNTIVKGLVISRFGESGIEISGEGGNFVEGNFIGTDVTGAFDMGNAGDGIEVANSEANTIGGTAPASRNVVSGNYHGINLRSGSHLSTINGNFIGTDYTGAAALGNSENGISIADSSDSNIGGKLAAARNVVSGNGGDGISLFNSGTGNKIQGNYIGVDATGSNAIGNGFVGVRIHGPDNNTVGGAAAGASNVISGNGSNGVYIVTKNTTANVIQGNLIGTDSSGTAAMGNGGDGIRSAGPSTIIGGATNGAGNLIAGNSSNGIYLGWGSVDTLVRGNYIGTDALASAPLGNRSSGIYLADLVTSVTIGGPGTGDGNVISGNGAGGILMTGTSNVANLIQGNLIGTDPSRTAALGNARYGLRILNGAHDNSIGGTSTAAANTIAYNMGPGVRHTGGGGNSLLGNSIFSNWGLAIDLGTTGVTANDAGDSDTGANNLQNFPVITSVTGGSTTIEGYLSSTANTLFRLEFYSNDACDVIGHGEGAAFLASVSVTTDANGNSIFSVVISATVSSTDGVTATATGPNNNTSEFSQCDATPTITVDSAGDSDDANVGDVVCDDGSGRCTLRAAIQETNARPEAFTIAFNISSTDSGYVSSTDSFRINPNPPKDRDGRREDSGRG